MQLTNDPSLIFLHFNDSYDIQPDKSGNFGFLNFYSKMVQLRHKYPNSKLIFSGDAFSPSKMARLTKGMHMVNCLKQLDISIACYGNHDFDFDPEHSIYLAKQCNCPWLMGNIKYRSTGKNIGDGLDYYIMEQNNLKIGFLGLAGPDFNGRLVSHYKDKLLYKNANQYGTAISKKLKEELKCDIVIGLTHMRRPIDEQLAKSVPNIDLILGGHDHFMINLEINKIPIIKSGHNFQFISVVKVYSKDQQFEKPKNWMNSEGRRWNFSIKSVKVPKCQNQNEHPTIKNHVKQMCQLLHQHELNKGKAKNKKPQKSPAPKLPQNKWQIEYLFSNNRRSVILKSGLSSQICFAKYLAFKKRFTYVGHLNKLPTMKQNLLDDTLDFISGQIRQHINNGDTILYGAGVPCVSYLCQMGNFIYLPSQFSVAVKSIKELQQMLEIWNKKGYKCYAVISYLFQFKTTLCAFIRFLEFPQQYISLINDLCIKDIVILSTSKASFQKSEDQSNSIRLMNPKNEKSEALQQGDIYIKIADQTSINQEKYVTFLGDFLKDYPDLIKLIKQPACFYINENQFGIDCINKIEHQFQKISKNQKINFWYILNKSVFKLNQLAYHLSKLFIDHNFNQENHPVNIKGVVFNQTQFSHPTYELNFGYIPILYDKWNTEVEKMILHLLNEEQKGMQRWLNISKLDSPPTIAEKNSTIVKSSHQGRELAKWIAKHSPKDYNLCYLKFQTIMKELINIKTVSKFDLLKGEFSRIVGQ